METLILSRTSEIVRNKIILEKKLGVQIIISGRKISVSGEPMEEYEAVIVLEAIDFGFSAQKALLLKEPDMVFERINIKEFSRKKDLSPVRSRIIGKHGQTLRVLEEVSKAHIILNENSNDVGIIGNAESINQTILAITNLIRGTKQANVYRLLEKSNRKKKDLSLGLKYKENKDFD